MATRGHIIRTGTPCVKILGLNSSVKAYERGVASKNDSSGSVSEIQGTPSGEKTKVLSSELTGERPLPEEPTNCCMSGCANCVWIKYAEELMNSFEGGSDVARKVIMEKVQDPNMKAFLAMELRTMGT